jgi:MFS family permease
VRVDEPCTVEPELSDSVLFPFRFPVFRDIWLASMASNLGGLIQSVGASWLMVSIAGSADMVALVQASVALPILTLSLLAGALADSFDRRRLMLAAQIFSLLVSVALMACSWLGLITPWRLLAFTFLIGCGTALYAPAWQASIGDMVPRRAVPGAVALNSLGYNLARSVGPALGGVIVAIASPTAAFSVNTLAYVGLILVLARWRPAREESPLPREAVADAVRAGIRYAALSPVIGAVLGRGVVFGLGASAIASLMPLLARDVVGGGPVTYGFLLAGFGVGAIAGAVGSGRLRRLISSEAIVRCASGTSAVTALLVGFSSSLPAALAIMFLAGAAWVLALSTFNVTVQLHAPRWVVARAISLYQMATFGGMTLGSWIWGVVAQREGMVVALTAAAVTLVLCALLGLRLPLAPVGELNLDPLQSWQVPETEAAIEGRSGPLVITIEYRIASSDQSSLLAAMVDQRRLRRRDGANDWTLSRDLVDAEIWIERFRLPTWHDYIRFINRMTHEDAATHNRVRSLHRGPVQPVVRPMLETRPGVFPAQQEPEALQIAERRRPA